MSAQHATRSASLSSQRKIFERLATQFEIRKPEDWGRLTVREVKKHGGATTLGLYSSSLSTALRFIYPGTEWKEEWFNRSHGYWQCPKQQREFFEHFARSNNISTPKDWSTVDVEDLGEGRAILNHFGGSLMKSLKCTFPEHTWEEDWFTNSRGYWRSKEHQKAFLDRLASSLSIKRPKEWGKVTQETIKEHGGVTLLNRHGGSIWKALTFVYPGKEVHWNKEWFPRMAKHQTSYWDSLENQRKFLLEIARANKIEGASDWKKVTISVLKKSGGTPLLCKYSGSLKQILRAAFPQYDWDFFAERQRFTATQSSVENVLEKIFEGKVLLKNHRFKQ